MVDLSVIRKDIPRIDVLEKVTGTASFYSDIKLPGMLYMKALRSPYPHARILSIDTSEAKKTSGVRCVVTGKDAPEKRFSVGLVKDRTVLAKDVVRYIGEPVAAVAAETLDIAEEAVELIKVRYEELPAVFDPEEAVSADPPVIIHPDFSKYDKAVATARLDPDRPNVFTHMRIRKGDVERGFKEADLIIENRFATPKMQHCSLETHGVIVCPEANGGLTLFAGRQDIWGLRGVLADVYGIRASKIRVIQQYVGGAFGGKMAVPEIVPSLLALKTGRPVKWIRTREEEFIDGGHKPAAVVYIKDGVKKDGTLVAREMKALVNAGAYETITTVVATQNGHAVIGDYRIPNVKWDSYGVYTNDPPACAFRGFGITDIIWAIESHMDMLAEQLGISPVEIRKKNLLKEGEPNAMGEITHSIAAEECIDKTVELIKLGEKSSEEGPWRTGKGIAIGNKYSTAPTVNAVRIKVTEEEKIIVYHSADEMGQGCNTVLAQIAAEEFGVSIDDIEIVFSDTAITPFFAEGSTSSRTTYNLGNAIRIAAHDAKRAIFQMAAGRLGHSPDELDTRRKEIYPKASPEKILRIGELFIPYRGKDPSIYGGTTLGGEIIGKAAYIQDFTPEDPETGQIDPMLASQGKRLRAFCVHGTKAAEVAVNLETGQVKMLRCVSITDIGKAINPKMCEQQSDSGMAMGIGDALYEEMQVVRGVVTNPNFTDYKIVSTTEMPLVKNINSVFVESAPHKDGPYGAKGLGEAVMVSMEPAIGNAIYDAVGVRITELPITPEKLFRALMTK